MARLQFQGDALGRQAMHHPFEGPGLVAFPDPRDHRHRGAQLVVLDQGTQPLTENRIERLDGHADGGPTPRAENLSGVQGGLEDLQSGGM